MKLLRGKVAAITGAGSGIGQKLAENLAAEGCRVAISDINKEGLSETAKQLEKYPVKVSTHLVDVSDRKQVYAFADEVVDQHGCVDMIINNAGVVVAESVEDVTYEDFEWLFGINFWGVVYGSKAFLPYLKKRPEGHIVNISSINGIVTWPNHSPYCAAKFAVKGFSESFLQEMRGSHINISCVHPGGVKTNVARNAKFYKTPGNKITPAEGVKKFEQIAILSPDKAAKKIIAGIKKNKTRIIVGPDAHIMDVLTRLFPVQFVRLMGVVTGQY